MARKKKKKDVLNRNERAMRNAIAHDMNKLLVERNFGNANGVHINPAEKRLRTRDAAKRKAIREQL